MVKIAVAGASGGLARDVIEALAQTGKHEIIGLMRKDVASQPNLPGVTWVQTKFDDKHELVRLLAGVNTALCFFTVDKDEGSRSQKLLIDAAIEAGVPRYIPSEWSIGSALDGGLDYTMYQNKLIVREYLAEINKDGEVLEYTLLWPGIFTNYLGYPHKTTKNVSIFPLVADLEAGTIIGVEGHENALITFTTVEDICAAVVGMIDYQGKWPVNGGLRGETITFSELVRVAERVTGRSIEVELLKSEDLTAGKVLVKKIPQVSHPAFSPEAMAAVWPAIFSKFILAMALGAWETTDEWNKLLPDLKPTGVEEYLGQLFHNKE